MRIVRPEALGGFADVSQQFPGRCDHVGGALALEGVQPSHACRVILEQDQVQSPPSRRDFPGAGKVNKNALQGECLPRRCSRRYGRTPPLRLYTPTASDQDTRELNALLLGRLAQKALVGVGVAHVKNVNAHYLGTSNAGDEHDCSNRREERGGKGGKAFFQGIS